MASRPSRRAPFTVADVARALKAGQAAGVSVGVRVEAATGDLLIFPCAPSAPAPAADPGADIDQAIDAAKW